MQRILIATDGSAGSNDAVDVGLELASEQHAKVFVVHVEPTLDVAPWSTFGMPAGVRHVTTEHDRAPLDAAVARAEELGVPVIAELLTGVVVDEIVAFADSNAVDLIVMGSRGHGAVVSAMVGSVSLGVLRESRRPVLIVRASAVRSTA